MDLEEALQVVGEFGRCQKRMVAVLILLQVYMAFQSMLIVLVGAVPDYHTETDVNPESAEAELSKHATVTEELSSIVTEWSLVKHQSYKVSLAGSLFFAGVLLGNVLFGPLADKIGRKPVFLTGLFFEVIFGFATAFAPSYESFALCRLLVGMMNGGMALVCFVLSQEYVGKSYWAMTGTLTNMMFAVGIALFAGLGYYVRQWRTLAAAANSPGVLFLLLSLKFPESPRWLYSQGQSQKAERVLQFLGQQNGLDRPQVNLKLISGPARPNTSRPGLQDLITHPLLRWRTVVLMFVWYACSLVYYGLTMNAGGGAGNRFVTVAMYGLVELPAYPLCFYFINKPWAGRRKTMASFLALAGVSCLFAMLMPVKTGSGSGSAGTCLALLGKLMVSAAFNIVYVYTSEQYPTVLRNAGLGVCSMSCRVGGILAPFVPSLAALHESMPFVVFGLSGVSAGGLSLLLQETLNRPIAETLDELHYPAYQRVLEKQVHLFEEDQCKQKLLNEVG